MDYPFHYVVLVLVTVLIIACIFCFIKVNTLKKEINSLISQKEELEAKCILLQEQTVELEYFMKVRHDIRSQFNTIYNYLLLGRIKELKAYILSIFDDFKAADKYPVGISPVLSIIIGQKKQEAREKQIDFDYHTAGMELGMQSHDITSLFGNLLENAMEAAAYTKNQRPYVELEVSRKEGTIYVCCRNSMDENRLNQDGGHFYTSKTDSENHGMGLSIIDDIMKKYHGTYKITTQDNTFVFLGEYKAEKKIRGCKIT